MQENKLNIDNSYSQYSDEELYREAVNYFNKACKYGCCEAYHYLGTCYLNGYGVAKDENFANECFRKCQDMEGA